MNKRQKESWFFELGQLTDHLSHFDGPTAITMLAQGKTPSESVPAMERACSAINPTTKQD